MDIETLREEALRLGHVAERMPYGPDCVVFEVGGKQFCLVSLSGEHDFYNLKVDPALGEALRHRFEGVTPGWHMNKRHWVSVAYEGDVDDATQRLLLRHAYHRTALGLPKRLLAQLDLSPDPDAFVPQLD